MTHAEELLQTLQSKPERADDGQLANELLREFHRGFPVSRLLPLLTSEDERIVRVGAFVATELGGKAVPLLPAMIPLLQSRNRHIRSDVIGSILTCTTGENQAEIAAVVLLLTDADWPIRWKSMEFLSLASVEQLQAGLQFLRYHQPDSGHADGLRWLISDEAKHPVSISSGLASESELRRKYAVVGAARMARANRSPLREAAILADDDVRQFAESKLRMIAEGG